METTEFEDELYVPAIVKNILMKRAKVKSQICPCCEQTVKFYHRRLYKGMLEPVIRLYRLQWKGLPNEWFHVQDFNPPHGDFAKTRFWGLIEPKDSRTQDENASGLWRVTSTGERFLKGEEKVMSKVIIYNNKFFGFAGELIDVREAMGGTFSYSELMR